MEDKILIEIFLLGFEQELNGTFKNEYEKDSLESNAYELGGFCTVFKPKNWSINLFLATIRNV